MSNDAPRRLPAFGNWLPILLGVISLAGLCAISQYNFLLFHCLAEAFSIAIAIAVFAIFWNTRQFLDNGVYLIVGFGCLFAGVLDLIYILAYPGMSVFPGGDANIALQAKTVAQWYVSLSCVCAVPFIRRKVNQDLVWLVYSALLALALGTIFYWRVFPACFVEGAGITPFERLGLAVSCSAYLGALALLVSNRREFDSYVLKLLAAILITFFVQDLASAVAAEMNGFARTVAHLCQVVALYFVYKAFVVVGLTRPYGLLFRRHQQSAEALRESEERLSLVMNAADTGAWDWSIASGELVWSPTCLALFGLPPTTPMSYERFLQAVHPDDRDRVDRAIHSAIQGHATYNVEKRIVWPDGSVHWVAGRGRAHYDASGRPVRMTGASMDITDRKRAEELLKQARDEQVERHRTELAHMARLNMMGEMAASLAHELNQPFHAINNYANGSLVRLLKTPESDRELVAALEQIGAEANRAAQLVRRVKLFVQKRETQFAEVLVNNLVEEGVFLSKAALAQRFRAKVVLDLADDLPVVLGDAIQIEQVIMNLVRNGLEAMEDMPKEERLLGVRTLRHGDEMVLVEVCDRGEGIHADNLEKVFEPFFTTKPEGMGMGLSISRSIVQAHGGSLWASTIPDQGCTFHFTLPTRQTELGDG